MENMVKTDQLLMRICWSLAFAGVLFCIFLVKMYW